MSQRLRQDRQDFDMWPVGWSVRQAPNFATDANRVNLILLTKLLVELVGEFFVCFVYPCWKLWCSYVFICCSHCLKLCVTVVVEVAWTHNSLRMPTMCPAYRDVLQLLIQLVYLLLISYNISYCICSCSHGTNVVLQTFFWCVTYLLTTKSQWQTTLPAADVRPQASNLSCSSRKGHGSPTPYILSCSA